jgi:hypothetical protein
MRTPPLTKLAALFLAALPLATLQAQEPRRVDIAYDITVAGLTGLRVEINAQFDGVTYDVESRTSKVGVLRALTPRYEGYNRAWGRLEVGDASLAPAGGVLSVVAGDQKRTWHARYGAGGVLEEMHDPPWHPTPAHAIGDKDRRGSLDPLTAILSVAMAGDAGCERTVASLDGRRRIDVVLRRIGTENPVQAGVPQATGALLVCEARLRRVAGEFGDSSGSSDEGEHPAKPWFAQFGSNQIRYPARFEAGCGLGLVRGRLLHIDERKLTSKEKTAMAR